MKRIVGSIFIVTALAGCVAVPYDASGSYPVAPGYASAYPAPQPVYVAPPAYVAPPYYVSPPVNFGLGLNFGYWGHGGWGHGGYHRH